MKKRGFKHQNIWILINLFVTLSQPNFLYNCIEWLQWDFVHSKINANVLTFWRVKPLFYAEIFAIHCSALFLENLNFLVNTEKWWRIVEGCLWGKKKLQNEEAGNNVKKRKEERKQYRKCEWKRGRERGSG